MRFEGVSLRYRRRAPWILEGVTLTLPAGQVATVVGRNGSGKTTLLSAAAGLLRPDRGRITDRPAIVGWVPERFPATLPFTAGGYLTRMAQIRGVGRAATAGRHPRDVRATVTDWADRLHLTPYLDTKLSELSKGTAQKVGLAQALLVPPGLLVLDEPWEGLDAQTRTEVASIVAEVVTDGGAVLISDHLGEVDQVPDAVEWRVERGRVSDVAPATGARCVIEVEVGADDAASLIARLRAEGHDVVGVREVSR